MLRHLDRGELRIMHEKGQNRGKKLCMVHCFGTSKNSKKPCVAFNNQNNKCQVPKPKNSVIGTCQVPSAKHYLEIVFGTATILFLEGGVHDRL